MVRKRVAGSDMLTPEGPHGIHVSEMGNYGTVGNPITPAAVIGYNPLFNGLIEPKGIGGDVFVFKSCNQRHCEILNSSNEAGENLSSLGAYPNPFNDLVNIEFFSDNAEEVQLKFFTAEGRLLYEMQYSSSSGQNVIAISNELLGSNNGLIFCRLETKDSAAFIKLFST